NRFSRARCAAALHRMSAWRGKEKLVLRDAERSVPDLIGRQVDRDEHVRLVAAGLEPMFGPQEAEFFLHRGEEDEVSLRAYAAAIEGAEHLESRHEVRGIVADPGRRQRIAFAADMDGCALREDCVSVGGEDHRGSAAGAFADPGDIEYIVHA